MQLANPFPLEVRLLFLYTYSCWECGGNGNMRGGMELHHIWGRVSCSAFNAAPLCRVCHAKVLHTQVEQLRYLKKTVRFLEGEQYRWSDPRDDEFFALPCVQQDLRGYTVSASIG